MSVVFVDDIDGSPASKTVLFSVQGKDYEIDLSAENHERLISLLAPFVDAARKPGTGNTPVYKSAATAKPAKRPGRPKGSVKKATATPTTPKRKPGRPKGSTKKEAETVAAPSASVVETIVNGPKDDAPKSKAAPNVDSDKVRAWANRNNIAVPKRGRLSNDIIKAYEAATA